jgi:hypothetical protein
MRRLPVRGASSMSRPLAFVVCDIPVVLLQAVP